ncbi:hypothetical protein [Agriterribacter sp.]|uniref:hypothetical protein n=1 Tax=Agriterribacter sp. TaxID=2821509 RepID=UPI002D121EA2|nr:hypothetical protein [Agriterribacter sp.]HTN09215.1 hypothetical protein [Agriterribacter sp.]
MTNVTHFQKTENTSFRKSFHVWTGETSLKLNGIDWKITTMKRHGGVIVSNAQKVQGNRDGSFMYSPFTDKSISLLSVTKMATEAAIKAAHLEALAKFDELNEAGELPTAKDVYEIKRGQLLRFEGYGHDMAIKYVVYDVDTTGNWGTHYKCVDIKQKDFHTVQYLKPVSEKFGIGTYYKEGEIMPEEELNNLVIDVAQIIKDRKATEKKQQEEKDNTTREAIERGKEVITAIPEGVKAVIVANLMEDDSDIMTDYFAFHSTKTIYLAFSTHTRDLFEEMKKAALNCVDTIHLAEGEENREKYSGGHGYYLGEKYSGWQVSKANISFNGNYGVTLEALQLAAGEGRYFIPALTKTEKANSTEVPAGSVHIIDYSDRAVAVIGDTKPIKDKLKELGGRFNFRLTCGAGWIFPKTKLDILKRELL